MNNRNNQGTARGVGAPMLIACHQLRGVNCSPTIVVAVIDTGVRFDHQDLTRAAAGGNLLPVQGCRRTRTRQSPQSQSGRRWRLHPGLPPCPYGARLSSVQRAPGCESSLHDGHGAARSDGREGPGHGRRWTRPRGHVRAAITRFGAQPVYPEIAARTKSSCSGRYNLLHLTARCRCIALHCRRPDTTNVRRSCCQSKKDRSIRRRCCRGKSCWKHQSPLRRSRRSACVPTRDSCGPRDPRCW